MNTRLLTALSTAEPNRPTLVSHASTFRRGIGASVLAVAIRLLLGGIHQIFQIAPEDLILGVFDVVKIVFFYSKDENAHRGQRHRQAADDGNPGQFHRVSSIDTITGRREMAACWARNVMVAPLNTSTSADCASAHTPCAGHHPWRVHAWSLVRHRLSRIGPSTASITSSTLAVRCNSSSSKPPVLPRREITRPARVRFCSTLQRNCSGHSAATDSSERLTRAPGGSPAR